MADENILIIGAGAAGLMAARQLAMAGKRVTLLEAQEKTGGRILDIPSANGSLPFMLGAEFIHGNAETTLSLIREAGLSIKSITGKNYRAKDKKLSSFNNDADFWPELMEKLELLTEDMTLNQVLDLYFKDEKYDKFRESVLQFVEGYDAADADRVSALSLKKEWGQDDEEHQYRIEGGYSQLIDFLEKDCIAHGVLLLTGKVVSHFNWSRGFVDVITNAGERYAGRKAVITVPLGVLQIKDGGRGFVTLSPPLPIRLGAVRSMGFGAVIKVVIQFKERFWPGDAGFIFTKAAIPVWWTQSPDVSAVLTGWLAGPRVEKYRNAGDAELIELALTSLSEIFEKEPAELQSLVVRAHACNWQNNPFVRGAYTYITVDEPNAGVVLSNPVQGTLYFSGEATYTGPHVGTVEAALVSGKQVAERILLG